MKINIILMPALELQLIGKANVNNLIALCEKYPLMITESAVGITGITLQY